MDQDKNARHITNQIGNGNAGRDIHNQESSPGTFKMPPTLKDELTQKAEALLAQLENMINLRSLLKKEIESYEAGHFSAEELEGTIAFITHKMSIV